MEKIVCERRMDEGLRTFKDGTVGTIRTICAGGDKRVIEVRDEKNDEKRYKNNGEILPILRSKIGEKAFSEWCFRGLFCILQEKILQQRLHEESIYEEWKQLEAVVWKCAYNSEKDKCQHINERQLRNLWENWKTGCSSYRRQLSEQQYSELEDFMQKLSYETAYRKDCLQNMYEASEGIGILQQTLSKIQKIWESIYGEEMQRSGYRIRKLTPLCCWRLMGFSDEDFISAKVGSRELAKKFIDRYEPNNHLEMMQEIEKVSQMSNTQLYKQAGNSIVTDVLYYIFKELYKSMPYLFDDLKVGSYFSGIGAFEIGLDRLYADINNENFI